MRDVLVYYRNNPSILFWGTGNNWITADHMRQMVDLRRAWDPNGGRAMGCRAISGDPAWGTAAVDAAEYVGTMLNRHYSVYARDRKPIIECEYTPRRGAPPGLGQLLPTRLRLPHRPGRHLPLELRGVRRHPRREPAVRVLEPAHPEPRLGPAHHRTLDLPGRHQKIRLRHGFGPGTPGPAPGQRNPGGRQQLTQLRLPPHVPQRHLAVRPITAIGLDAAGTEVVTVLRGRRAVDQHAGRPPAAAELYRAGLSPAKIAERYGTTTSSVRKGRGAKVD
jgi:hypothetical protein